MPQVNGFTLAEEMYGILPEICIVFVTGFDEYALKAFEINAVDYILKPVSKTRFLIKLSVNWSKTGAQIMKMNRLKIGIELLIHF